MGQATIEYLFIMIFMALIGIKFVQGVGNYMGKSVGNLAHVLSVNLTVGVCEDRCFFRAYDNGHNPP